MVEKINFICTTEIFLIAQNYFDLYIDFIYKMLYNRYNNNFSKTKKQIGNILFE